MHQRLLTEKFINKIYHKKEVKTTNLKKMGDKFEEIQDDDEDDFDVIGDLEEEFGEE